MVSETLFNYAENCVNQFLDQNSSVSSVYRTKISHEYEVGSGVVIKIEDGPLNRGKRANSDESAIEFTISDGQYAIQCIAHNGDSSDLNAFSSNDLTDVLLLLTDSMAKGQAVRVCGNFILHNKEKVFRVNAVQPLEDSKKSQLTGEQFQGFVQLCKKHGSNPMEVMMDDSTLWRHVYAENPIKSAVMLSCLSPFKKQDMIHMAVITSMGEGKDHLIENVIQPLVPCGIASTGKLCTIPGLFGAMSGEDLNSVELGLIGKMNNERMAVSEFQTWGADVFGELMNMLANGYYTMQKGQVDVKRDAILNMSFWGNPAKEYQPPEDGAAPDPKAKLAMLDVFKEYTYQMISRMSLMYCQMSLTDKGADEFVESKILDAMSGQLDSPASKHKLQVWRSFFREYLRYVSRLEPDILGCKKHIMDIYNNDIKAHKNFDTVFLRRSAKENRKFQQFINLSKGIARLRGDEKVGIVHLTIAKKLFLHSLETLVTNLVPMGMDLSDLNAEQMHLMSTVERLSDNGQYESKVKLIKTLKDSGTNITMQKVDELIASNFLVEGTLDGDPMIEINPDL